MKWSTVQAMVPVGSLLRLPSASVDNPSPVLNAADVRRIANTEITRPHRRKSPRQVANHIRAQRPRLIPVRQRLPKPGMVNGYHAALGVVALTRFGARPCYFSFQGGDALYPDVPPLPNFHTDEGLPITEVTHWMPLPRGLRG